MSELQALERQREAGLEQIELRNIALKLHNNPEFKKLILDNFCLKECARYVQASGDPALNAESRQDALNIAQAAGHLKRYLSVVIQMGNHAERQMPDLDNAILECMNGGEDSGEYADE